MQLFPYVSARQCHSGSHHVVIHNEYLSHLILVELRHYTCDHSKHTHMYMYIIAGLPNPASPWGLNSRTVAFYAYRGLLRLIKLKFEDT